MPTFVRIASKSELPPGSGKTFQVGGKSVAVFNAGGEFLAVDDRCAHMGGPLGEGSLEGCIVTCPWHGWKYDLKTGRADRGAARVAPHPVRLEGDDVLVSLE